MDGLRSISGIPGISACAGAQLVACEQSLAHRSLHWARPRTGSSIFHVHRLNVGLTWSTCMHPGLGAPALVLAPGGFGLFLPEEIEVIQPVRVLAGFQLRSFIRFFRHFGVNVRSWFLFPWLARAGRSCSPKPVSTVFEVIKVLLISWVVAVFAPGYGRSSNPVLRVIFGRARYASTSGPGSSSQVPSSIAPPTGV